jgi:predicted esterase
LDAPHQLPKKEGNEVSGRYWFGRTPAGEWDQQSLDTSFEVLRDAWTRDGPFNGILAFSQGGTFATLAASLWFPSPPRGSASTVSCSSSSAVAQALPGLKFIICFGAPELAKWPAGSSISGEIRSLHFGGKTDTIVPINSSRQLAQRYAQHEFHEHEQGHCIPMKRPLMDIVIKFMMEMRSVIERGASTETVQIPRFEQAAVGNHPSSSIVEDNNSRLHRAAAKPQPAAELVERAAPVCASDSIAEQQSTEIEALCAIFDASEVSIIRPAPGRAGEPTGCVVIRLCSSEGSGDENWFCGDQIQLRFEMFETYPENSPLQIQLTTGNLSLLQFTIAMRKSLLTVLVRIVCSYGTKVSDSRHLMINRISWLQKMATYMHVLSQQKNGFHLVPGSTFPRSVAAFLVPFSCA